MSKKGCTDTSENGYIIYLVLHAGHNIIAGPGINEFFSTPPHTFPPSHLPIDIREVRSHA